MLLSKRGDELNIYKKIKNAYGAGTSLTWRSSGIVIIVSILLGLLWYCFLSDVVLTDTTAPAIKTLLPYYLTIIIVSIGFLVFAVFLYSKVAPKKDKYEIPKKLFLVIMVILLSILFFPFTAIFVIFYGISKYMRIERLTVDIVYSLLCIVIWLMLWYFFFVLFNTLGDIALIFTNLYFINIHAIVNEITVLHFSMFFSLVTSNCITKRIYFALVKINEDGREKASHQMKLLWNYTILLFSFLAKPLNFPDESMRYFFDALFYSAATISLLATVRKMRFDSE